MTQPASINPAFPIIAGFDQSGWIRLSQLLVGQDVVLAPHSSRQAPEPSTSQELTTARASALALIQNWETNGFTLSRPDVLHLCQMDPCVHAWMNTHITPALNKRLGGHRAMRPMYPNFPAQVMKMDEAELLYNAIAHYVGSWAGVLVVPYTNEKQRSSLPRKDTRSRVLRLADLDTLRTELVRVYAMNTVWTPAQAELAVHAMPLAQHWGIFGPSTALPQRENQARLVGQWLSQVASGELIAPLSWPANRISATDILRAVVSYSGGDPSLASSSPKTRIARMTRPMRRIILTALTQAIETTADPLTELHAHRQSWLRVAEQLHAGEWARKFPAAVQILSDLRNEPAPVSWSGKLDAVLSTAATAASVKQVQELIRQSPGQAARAMVRIINWTAGSADHDKLANKIIRAFADVAPKVDTPVLLSLEAALQADMASPTARSRVMFPKGQAAYRYRVPARTRPQASNEVLHAAAQVCETALLARFSELPELGTVYVEPGLDGILVPKGMRSSSSEVCAVTRGSQIPVGADAKVVRLFLWWKDTEQGSVDVDLSGVGLDSEFQAIETCNYHGMKKQGMVHSGDLTSAPNGAAEFIDINLDSLDPRTRYVVLSANVFRGPAFSRLPECFVGWQERATHAQRGEIHELGSVVEKFPVTTSKKGFLGVAFDVEQRKLIWLDLPLGTAPGRSIHASHDEISAVVEDMGLYAFGQPTLARLVELHIAARNGEPVDTPKSARTVFSVVPRKARANQTVICAIQPQSVASELLPSSSTSTLSISSKVSTPAIEHQQNELGELLKPGKTKAAVKRKVSQPRR